MIYSFKLQHAMENLGRLYYGEKIVWKVYLFMVMSCQLVTLSDERSDLLLKLI